MLSHLVDDAVGVVCESSCNDGDLRLVNGSSSYEGRVEVCTESGEQCVMSSGLPEMLRSI